MYFVFDLDGTICFKGQPVSDKIIDSLTALTEGGHQIIFASARPIRDMLPVIREDCHHYTMIGGNGSLISKQGKITHSVAFTPDELTAIVDLITEFEATYLIDGDWDYAYTGPHDHPILANVDPAKKAKCVMLDSLTSIVKILILTSKDNHLLAERLGQLDVFVNQHRHEDVLDISPKGIHKWSALQTLGIKKGSYIAFGNDANDLTLFENASHSVMIGHHDELFPYAKESLIMEADIEGSIILKLKELSESVN